MSLPCNRKLIFIFAKLLTLLTKRQKIYKVATQSTNNEVSLLKQASQRLLRKKMKNFIPQTASA